MKALSNTDIFIKLIIYLLRAAKYATMNDQIYDKINKQLGHLLTNKNQLAKLTEVVTAVRSFQKEQEEIINKSIIQFALRVQLQDKALFQATEYVCIIYIILNLF